MVNASSKSLRFLFLGYERDWNPLEGCEPPKGRVTVLRSLPGGVVAAGRSLDEARHKLQDALTRHFDRAGSEG